MNRSFSSASLSRIFSLAKPQLFSSSHLINDEISKIVALAIRDYISAWFDTISPNEDIYSEILRLSVQIIAEVEHRCSKIDWVVLVANDLPHIIMNHIVDHRTCSAKVGTAYAGGKTFRELFNGTQPHIALSSPAAEKEYLRRLADIVVETLLPPQECQSETVRLLIRELVTNVLLGSIVEYLADPDYLNEWFLHMIDPEELEFRIDSTESDAPEAPAIIEPFSSTVKQTLDVKEKLILRDAALFEVTKTKKTGKILAKLKRNLEASPTNMAFKNNIFVQKMSTGIGKLKTMVTNS